MSDNLFSTKNVRDGYLTRENISKFISEYDIFNYFIPGITIGNTMPSPFRVDKKPSFGLYISDKTGELMFNDFKLGAGNCFKFIQMYENCTYKEALNIVNNIFKLGFSNYKNQAAGYKPVRDAIVTNKEIIKRRKPKISIKKKEWTSLDTEYWHPLIQKDVIDAIPIQFFWIDDQLFGTAKLAYAYRYGLNVYKIYQPEVEGNHHKWWSNISIKNIWYGHQYLPPTGDYLFIASSNKDAMVLRALGYNVLAPHTESQIFTAKQYEYYSKRFKHIIVFYDNDATGILKSKKFCSTYNLNAMFLEEDNTKDPFEFVKKYTLLDLHEYIEDQL